MRRREMTTSTTKIRSHLLALAAAAVWIVAGLATASPAAADHDDGPRFGFFFGFPAPPPPPPVVIYGPPLVYYYDPAPRVVYGGRPYYRDWNYRERRYRDDNWRGHHHNRN